MAQPIRQTINKTHLTKFGRRLSGSEIPYQQFPPSIWSILKLGCSLTILLMTIKFNH